MCSHLFVHNIEAGITIRCNCRRKCASPVKDVKSFAENGSADEVEYMLEEMLIDQTMMEQSTDKLFYKNDPIAMTLWSHQVKTYHSILPGMLHDPLVALPSPPLTPRKRKRSTSHCSSDQLPIVKSNKPTTSGQDVPVQMNIEQNQPKSVLDLLADAVDFIENNPTYKSYVRYTPRSAEFKDKFVNLIMLADEAAARSELRPWAKR
ncbi:uncharacterized protein LOC119079008 [Bradysia coprophila]|uniref:uncharacterized protein LOC119079008 n=1 Tax=Bradysia coprophila TaxID=38358 RepID=UPI00187DD506|nr:uncharacterized protein LOC119079008 [Bradysia coprophila]